MELTAIRGLNNLGNSCFMNSALQCLTQIKPLVKLVMDERSKDHEHKIFNLFREHLQAYYQDGKGGHAISPRPLFSNLKRINFRMTPGRQHDAHEFALGILSGVEDYFAKDKRTKQFEQVFGGKLASQITCFNCKHVSTSFESMVSLSLVASAHKDINKARSVEEALKDFFKPDALRGENRYRCEKCKVKVEAKKQYHIHKGSGRSARPQPRPAAPQALQLPGEENMQRHPVRIHALAGPLRARGARNAQRVRAGRRGRAHRRLALRGPLHRLRALGLPLVLRRRRSPVQRLLSPSRGLPQSAERRSLHALLQPQEEAQD